MHNLHEDHQRRMPQQMGYDVSPTTGSTRGYVIALLVIVILMGGLALLAGSNTAPVTDGDGVTGVDGATGGDTQSGAVTTTPPNGSTLAD